MWFNPIMKWLLASPFKAMVDQNTMLVTYQGRRSGNTFQTPVNYIRDADNPTRLYTTSSSDRSWWRNFRAGGAARLQVKSQDLPALGEVAESSQQVAALLAKICTAAPNFAGFFKVQRQASGDWDPQGLLAAAQGRVVVVWTLES